MFQLILTDVFITSSSIPPHSFDFLLLQKAGGQLPIHRSHSVPVLNKDGSLCSGGVFRVIPTTPQVLERTVSKTSCTSPKDDNGNYAFQLSFTFCSHNFPCRNLPKCQDIPIVCIILPTFNPSLQLVITNICLILVLWFRWKWWWWWRYCWRRSCLSNLLNWTGRRCWHPQDGM